MVSLALVGGILFTFGTDLALAASARDINRKVNAALTTLYERELGAKALVDKAKGVLVFPISIHSHSR